VARAQSISAGPVRQRGGDWRAIPASDWRDPRRDKCSHSGLNATSSPARSDTMTYPEGAALQGFCGTTMGRTGSNLLCDFLIGYQGLYVITQVIPRGVSKGHLTRASFRDLAEEQTPERVFELLADAGKPCSRLSTWTSRTGFGSLALRLHRSRFRGW
jgi:hypothetical protein